MNRRTAVAAGIALVLVLCIALYYGSRQLSLDRTRVYRIGWDIDPPFQVMAPDGQPTGFSIELIRRAAQHRGIQLKWVLHPASSEDSLRKGLVDLWPLITITPERKQFIHFSDPYIEHEHYLMVRAASSYWKPTNLTRAVVAHMEQPMIRRHVSLVLPEARLLPTASSKEAMEALCQGLADAAFVDEFSGISTLLGGLGCADQPLRVIWLPGLRTQLAIGATFAAGVVADQLRDEITRMGQQEELPEIMNRWGYYSPQNLATMNALLNARKVKRQLISTSTFFGLLFLFTLLAADRIRRQRNRIGHETAGREEAEKELREWEQRFRDLLESAQLVAIIIDLDNGVSFCNDYALSITGWRREEMIGRPAKEFLEAGYLRQMADAIEDTEIASRLLPSSESAILTRNGEPRWIQWTSTVLRGTDGSAVGFAGLGEDVTELKRLRTEAAIRESEERFREIFQRAAVGVARIDLEGVVALANDQYHEILECQEGELVGKNLRDFTHPDDVEPHLTQLRRLIAGEFPSFSMEKRYIRKDGVFKWARLHESLVRDQDNNPKHFIAILSDIDELKKAEGALRESEERFRNMADTAPVLIWVSGTDKQCTFFNKGWLTFTGKTLEEEIGEGWAKGVHPDDVDRCWTTYANAFDARRAFNMEYRLRSADGTYRWIRDDGVPRFGPDSVFAGYIGCCIDVTDSKRDYEETLARQKLESLGVLSGGIAHDFNNLLGSILADSELALAELPEHSPGRDELARINMVSLRAAEIVRELLAYAGQESATSEPINLAALVDEMLQLLRFSISKRAILTVDLPASLPAIRGNPAQMRQVVMNLVTNASEALGQGGGVITVNAGIARITSDPEADREADLPGGDYIRLQINDTGSGMTEEVLARIFDPYFSTKAAGRGLGLGAVQGIIRGHGGKILVTSAPGKGTTFEILLRTISEPALTVSRQAEPGSADAVRSFERTVLIVEDEYTLRVPVSKMLRNHGFTVIEAGDGLAAIELFQAHSRYLDVVLLDMTLPGKPGAEVLVELRRIRPDMKVIVTTAYSQKTMLGEFHEQNVWAFIRKPYHLGDLVKLIARACAEEPALYTADAGVAG